VTTSESEVVAALGENIAQLIGQPRYNLWFGTNTTFQWEDDQLVVGVPNRFYQEWLQNTFADAVRAAASAVLGRTMRVRFTIDAALFQAARQIQADVDAARHSNTHVQRPNPQHVDWTDPFPKSASPTSIRREAAAKESRRWHRLSEFLVGSCNRVAHASALSAIETPGEINPLVLHGPVGTGKTHLLEGIYAGIRKQNPAWRVLYVTAEEFTNRFIQGMRLGKLDSFRSHFRECDTLLLDDLHFLASKRATQEEFLHTFDSLQAAGKQVVVSCDCHPRLTEELTPELTDRLLGGAIAGLAPPDAATRVEILRAKSTRGPIPISEEVLRHIAEHLRGNVRELHGALQSLWHYARVASRPIDMTLAREALAEQLRHAVRVVQLEDVDRAVCKVLRLQDGALQSKQRAWTVSHPRMLAMYLARKHTGAAYSEIGRYFGKRNHSTAVAAEKKIRRWMQDNTDLVLGEQRLGIGDVVELVERELQH
jgi:chromosomal replication initiator protein